MAAARGISLNALYVGVCAALGGAMWIMWRQEMGTVKKYTE